MSWNRDRSVILSQISTWVIMALGLILAAALPFLCTGGFFDDRAFIDTQNVMLIMPAYYAFCIPIYVALISLNRLLAAVKRGEIFTARNVRFLRIISWACFLAAFILLVSTYVSITFFAFAIIATFFDIVLRTMKNLFAAAVELREESDYTI